MLATITAHTTTPFLLLPPPSPPLLLLLPLQLVLLLPPPPRRYHHYQCNLRLQLLPLPLLLLLLTLTARPLQVLLPLLLDLRISSAPKHSESSCGPTKDYMPISFKNYIASPALRRPAPHGGSGKSLLHPQRPAKECVAPERELAQS